jgi:hypothetical protein
MMATNDEAREECIITKDRWTILTLRVLGHVPERIESVAYGSTNVLMFHFPNTAQTDFDRYMRGVPIPVQDIRDVVNAEREFKDILRNY